MNNQSANNGFGSPAVKTDDDHKGVFLGAFTEKRPWWRGGGKTTHYLRHDGPEHVLAFASGVGCGRGVGMVVPTLLTWDESAVVYDFKGDARHLTSGYRHSIGQKVCNFDPMNEDPSAVAGFNPLAEVRLGTPHEAMDAQTVAYAIVDSDGRGLRNHWAKASQEFLAGLILHCCWHAQRERSCDATMADVDAFFALWRQEEDDAGKHAVLIECLTRMRDYPHMGDKPNLAVAYAAQSMLDRSAAEQAHVVSDVIDHLAPYTDPMVAAHTNRSDWRVADLTDGDNPATVYLVVRPADTDRLRPLMRLVVTLIARRLTTAAASPSMDGDVPPTSSYKRRVLLMLDEFTMLNKLSIVEEALPYMACSGVKAFLIVRDPSHLEAAYGKEETITTSCTIRVCLSPVKKSTALVMEQLSAKSVAMDEWWNLKPPEKSPRDNAMLRAGDVGILIGVRPILGQLALYFRDETLRARSMMPPHDPKGGDAVAVSEAA